MEGFCCELLICLPRRTKLTEMGAKQENHAHHAPEVVQQDYPEAVAPQQQHQQQQFNQHQQYQQNQQYPQYQQYQQYPLKPEDAQYPSGGGPYSAYSNSQLDPTSPRPQAAALGNGSQAPAGEGKKKGTICGCTVLVFVLCTIIALLSAAVIGLAAGTGVEASRANTADARAAQLSSSLASVTATATATGDAAAATSTSFAQLDRNCSSDPNGVTGTTYDAFSRKPFPWNLLSLRVAYLLGPRC